MNQGWCAAYKLVDHAPVQEREADCFALVGVACSHESTLQVIVPGGGN